MAAPDYLRYLNQNATRNKPLSPQLASALGFLPELGVTAEVFSGGQDGKGEGNRRTGSVRHDHGDAADVFFSRDGRRLDWANPEDRPVFEEIVRRGKANGITGIGAGPGYMSAGSMHLGFGAPGVWGAGGRSANAPDWLRAAYGEAPTGTVPATGGGQETAYGGAGNDDLSGGTMAQNPMPENVGGLGGLGGFVRSEGFGDWLSSLGASLMQSPSNAPLAGMGDALAQQQALRQRQDAIDIEQTERAEKKAKENQTLAYAEQHYPEIAGMMRAGMSGTEAFSLMAQMSRGQTPELTADQRNFQMAQQDPEFAKFIGVGKDGFRPATADEAAAYGATAGQIGPDNRFYPIDPPTGMTVESDGKGGVRIVQGAGGKSGGAFTEGQGKDNVYSTRARGALPTLDTYADALDSYGQRLMDADPTGIVRGRYQDSDYQVAKTAADEFLQAILRKDTGAAITTQEQEMYGRTYLPQPGDSREVKAYKAKARQRAIAAIEAGMSPSQMVAQERALEASGGNEPVVPGSDGGAKRRKFNPATGTIE